MTVPISGTDFTNGPGHYKVKSQANEFNTQAQEPQ